MCSLLLMLPLEEEKGLTLCARRGDGRTHGASVLGSSRGEDMHPRHRQIEAKTPTLGYHNALQRRRKRRSRVGHRYHEGLRLDKQGVQQSCDL